MHPAFSIDEALRFGWAKTKQHSMLVFQVVLTIFAINIAQSIIDRVMHDTLTGAAASLVLSILGTICSIGATFIALKLVRGELATYSNLVPPWPLLWKYFVTSLLLGVIVVVGLVLLIIPGIYFALRFSMAPYAIIDGAEIMDSFRISTKLTDGVKWHLLGFMVVIVLLNIVGFLLLIVGSLVTLPVTMLAFAHVYTKLKAKHHAHIAAAN